MYVLIGVKFINDQKLNNIKEIHINFITINFTDGKDLINEDAIHKTFTTIPYNKNKWSMNKKNGELYEQDSPNNYETNWRNTEKDIKEIPKYVHIWGKNI